MLGSRLIRSLEIVSWIVRSIGTAPHLHLNDASPSSCHAVGRDIWLTPRTKTRQFVERAPHKANLRYTPEAADFMSSVIPIPSNGGASVWMGAGPVHSTNECDVQVRASQR